MFSCTATKKGEREMSLNKIILMGRLARDPELKRTTSGTAVTSFRIAVDRDFKSQDGSKQADFFDVVAWRSTAEFVSKYFGKGRMAVVEGRLQIRDWTDKAGNRRTTAEVVADNVYFADSKRSESNENQKENFNALSGRLSDDFVPISEEDGEIPF